MHDDRAVTEPYTDLPAIGLVAAGIPLFGYLLCSAYLAYEAKAGYVDLKDDLRTMAVALTTDPDIACEGTATVLDAGKLDNLSLRGDFLCKYGRAGEGVSMEIIADRFTWTSGPSSKATAGYALPVAVRLNDARCLPGTLTISLTEGMR
jgi:hypothetical protein